MGFFNDHLVAQYEGNTIEIEGKVKSMFIGTNEYSLIIDNERVDSQEVTLGQFSLRGSLLVGDSQKNLVVWGSQGLTGLKCRAEVDGRALPMSKVK